MTRTQATAIGYLAILMWSFLALFTVGSAPVPPLLLNAICFAIGGAIGLAWTYHSGGLAQLRQVPAHVYLFGSVGLFGYHFLYFSALRLAPAAEAGLIAYLWPLLIVLFSGLLPGEQLRRGHFFGAGLAFVGAGLIVAQGGNLSFQSDHLAGYGLAALCALTWSTYSVLSRRVGDAPTSSVTVFCLVSAALSALLHSLLEQTIWPVSILGWASVFALGIGPVGLAFFVWDVGVKKGDIQLLGTLSYTAPLLSTLILVLSGVAQPSFVLLLSAIAITAGALMAARASARNQA
ncbi:MAG: DMT family transporter [Arenibacterium sp.]